MFELLAKLFNTLGYLITISFVFTLFKSSKNILTKEKQSKKDIFFLSLFFSSLAIVGTYIGIDYKGSIANTRNIGVVVGGLLAGPEVSIIAGFLASIHRIFFYFDSFTAIPCGIGTFLGGFITYFFYKKSTYKNKPFLGFICGAVIENLSMILILLLSKDKKLAWDIVKNLYFPMIVINGVGSFIILFIINEILEEKENEAGNQAKLALEIANKTLPYLKKGHSLNNVCKIILDSLDAQIVIITDKEKILAFSSKEKNLNIINEKLKSNSTKEVIKTGKVIVLDKKNEIKDLNYISKNINSCVIAPIFQDEEVNGTLKIYFKNDSHITARKKFLAIGLSQLISTQFELSKLETLKIMARDAELKALQTQINPHFLFNALNTITSFVRINPSKAREIIIDLSTYLRYNLEHTDKLVPLSKELEQVKAYINIEQARFNNKFDVIFDIPFNIEKIKIPSLIIQPLIENSIKHGILKQREKGIIKLTIKKINTSYLISIEDNGVGIDDQIIKNLDTEIEKNIGLKNVHNRLKLLFGKGLAISHLPKGTLIEFEVKEEL